MSLSFVPIEIKEKKQIKPIPIHTKNIQNMSKYILHTSNCAEASLYRRFESSQIKVCKFKKMYLNQ